MVKVASERQSKGGVTGNESGERVKYSHKTERAKFKTSTMMNVGDLEESIFVHGLALA